MTDQLDPKKFEALIQEQIREHVASHSPNPPTPEFIALEKALKERHHKEADNLAQSHKAELKPLMSYDKYLDITDRHAKERQRHEAKYHTDLQRYAKEQQDAQNILKDMEEQSRTDSLKPDQPRR